MNTAIASAATTPQSFRDVWLITTAHGLTHWYVATFYILLPLIGKELGLSYTEIGLIMTTLHLASAISNIPGGFLADTVGRKGYLMAFALFWVGFPYALMSVAHSFWMLLICVSLVGMGNNLWHPTAIPTLAHRYPDRKGLVLSIHGMGGNVGEALAPLVIGALLVWFSWRTVVVANVVPGLVMSVIILVMLGALGAAKAGSKDAINAAAEKRSLKLYVQDFANLLRNKAVILIACSASFRSMTQAGLLTFLPVYLAYELNYSPFAVGACLTVIQLAGFLSAPVAGHLSDKLGRKRVVNSSMVLTAVAIVGMALAGQDLVFVLFIALIGFFLYATRAVMQAWALESAPKNMAGTSIALQFGVQALGASISPAVFGMIADTHGLLAGFYFLAGIILVANVLVYFVPNGAVAQAKPATT
jgi:sugar phosphate permease